MTFAPTNTIPNVRFSHYGPKVVGDGVTLHDLMAMMARDGLFTARAEDSGSEGTYCEVCVWNALTNRFERYAFKKFLGGEFDVNGVTDDVVLAEYCAKLINDAAWACNRKHPPLIHYMPTYVAPDSDELKQFNLAKSAPDLLRALEELTSRVDTVVHHGYVGSVIKKSYDVIAKAKGEA